MNIQDGGQGCGVAGFIGLVPGFFEGNNLGARGGIVILRGDEYGGGARESQQATAYPFSVHSRASVARLRGDPSLSPK
jgi:hypothetical protein